MDEPWWVKQIVWAWTCVAFAAGLAWGAGAWSHELNPWGIGFLSAFSAFLVVIGVAATVSTLELTRYQRRERRTDG